LDASGASAVTANDYDHDAGDTLTAHLAQWGWPAHAAADGFNLDADGSFSYVPEAGYFGSDNFTYYLTNGAVPGSNSNSVTVEIDVCAEAPEAAADSFRVRHGETLTGNLLDNDAIASSWVGGAGGAPEPFAVVVDAGDLPTHGALTFNAVTGAFQYDADEYAGTDLFYYRLQYGPPDYVHTMRIPVEIEIWNGVPLANPDYASGHMGTQISGNVLLNDGDRDPVDREGDEDYTNSLRAEYTDGLSGSHSSYCGGTFTLESNGDFTYTAPSTHFVGTDFFWYRATDDVSESQMTKVTVDVRTTSPFTRA
jgi:hypothetical protein